MERGQIAYIPFPYTDRREGKRRPVCVISSGQYNDGPDLVVAMVTSSVLRLSAPGLGDVVLDGWREAGLPLPSVIRTGRIETLERRLLGVLVGSLTTADLSLVDDALRDVLDLG